MLSIIIWDVLVKQQALATKRILIDGLTIRDYDEPCEQVYTARFFEKEGT